MSKHILAWIALAAGTATGLAGGFLDNKPLLILGIAIAFLGLVAQAHRFRCPQCGKKVATDRYGNGQKCPHCGGELE